MPIAVDDDLIQQFLGSAHIFSTAIEDVVEKEILLQAAGETLTHSQFRLLKLVAQTEARTIRDVAKFLAVSNAAASKAVDRLVRKGMLNRSESKSDRREIALALTRQGEELLARYDALKNDKLSDVFGRFSASDLRRVSSLLDRLSAGIVVKHASGDDVCLQCGIYYRDRCIVRELAKRNCFYQERGEKRASRPSR